MRIIRMDYGYALAAERNGQTWALAFIITDRLPVQVYMGTVARKFYRIAEAFAFVHKATLHSSYDIYRRAM